MTTYDTVVGVDSAYNFPPEVREAIAASQEIQDAIAAMTSGADNGAVPVGKGEQVVYVEDYLDPNRVPGLTDDRAAFEAARLTGKKVFARAGTFYLSKSPDWSDNAFFKGAGKGKTIIKFLDSAPADATLWGNVKLTGTVQGYFSDFTLDGNCNRQGGTLVAAGGSRSSNLTFRNTQHFYVDRVSSINPLLHCFDVTRGHLDYAYLGDGNLATLRSSNVYFDQCDGTNFGDDGFTCHSSDYIHISRSIFYSPRMRTNCNGLEFDGDSRHCTGTNNLTINCYAGIEIKGHGNESAAQDIQINGHIDIGSVRSYNFRHIGFHEGTDPISKTAKNILATNLISINPNNDAGFQDDATPRALAISAYHGVTINGFTAIGRGGYKAGDVAVAIQYRARNINISGINITGWLGADQDISITTGDFVTLSGTIENSAKRAIYVGSTVTSVKMLGLHATAPTDGSAMYGIDCYSTTSALAVDGSSGITIVGYPTAAIRAAGVNWASWNMFVNRALDVPAGTTRIIDLDPSRAYYASSAVFATLTDIPSGATGGYFIQPSNCNSDSVVRTITRNTSGTSQTQYWRVENYISKTSSAWNKNSFTVA
jgi:hypothetical protein